MKFKPKVALLAPEIPALSATFVSNEILELQRNGIEVLLFSVREPKTLDKREECHKLKEECCYLYSCKAIKILCLWLLMALTNLSRTYNTLRTVLKDMVAVGVFKRLSLTLLWQCFHSVIVARELKRHHCEHLHIHFAHVPTQIGMYASILSGCSFSFTSHANDLFVNNNLLDVKAKRCKNVVTISEFNKEFLLDHHVEIEKINVIPCGVDCHKKMKEKLKDITKIKIGSLGRLVEKKGMNVLLQAAALLKTKDIPFELQIAGDGPLREELQTKAKELNIVENVIFLGAIPSDRVLSWMEKLDVFVLACQKSSEGDIDGIPVVLMEAMLKGIPVISTNISGVGELIKDKESGLLAEAGDANSLFRAIEKMTLIQDRGNMVKKARETIESRYSLQKNVRRLIKEVLEVSDGSAKNRYHNAG